MPSLTGLPKFHWQLSARVMSTAADTLVLVSAPQQLPGRQWLLQAAAYARGLLSAMLHCSCSDTGRHTQCLADSRRRPGGKAPAPGTVTPYTVTGTLFRRRQAEGTASVSH